MKHKAVLFDLDGTLLDTLLDLTDSVNRGLIKLGFAPHRPETIKYFIGDGREVLAMKALPEKFRDEKTVNRLVDYINEEYLRCWADHTAPYPGIPELLDILTARGLRLAILSNKPHDFTELTVSRLLSRWRFDVVAGAVPSIPKKPDPAAALQIANHMGIQPAEFLYLGDSEIDMQTAVAARMFAVGACWGFRTAGELLAGGAQALLEKPLDLIDLL